MTTRRKFPGTLAGGLLSAPRAAGAQQVGKLPRIGVLTAGDPSYRTLLSDTIGQALGERGYVEGQSIALEHRIGAIEQLPDFAAELVRFRVDAIVAIGTPAVLAAKQATSTIPIVIAWVADPVGRGFVASLARPGGNVTGVSWTAEVYPKGFQLLKETVPRVSRVAVLMDPENPSHAHIKNGLDVASKVLGVKVERIEVRTAADLDGVFATALRQRADALFELPLERLGFPDHRRIIEFAIKNRMPMLMSAKEHVKAGALMSYAPNLGDHLRRTGFYIDKILKGAKPADLPVEQPMTFELVINLKTAKALGLTIPPSVLGRADEVLQ